MKQKSVVISLIILIMVVAITLAITSGRNEKNSIKVIAHRGFSGEYPENTVLSFMKAIETGADMIELDVQETNDGKLIVFHDDNLERITGVSGQVSEFTYEEITHMDAGKWMSDEFVGERIPLLSEVFDAVRDSDVEIYVELKDLSSQAGISDEKREDFPRRVVSLAEEFEMIDRVIFASFNYEYICKIEDMNDNYRTLFITTIGSADEILASYPAEYYGILMDSVSDNGAVCSLNNNGKIVYVWTVNEEDMMVKAIDIGVDGIISNYPNVVKQVIGR